MRVAPLLVLAVLLVGCGQQDQLSSPGDPRSSAGSPSAASQDVPDRVRQEADAEMALHGRIIERRGCATLTVRQLRDQQQRRQNRDGSPISGWLIEAPQDGRVYACRYSAEMTRSGAAERVTARVLIPDGVQGAPLVSIQTGEDAETL